jgi:hypothetical protein
VGDFTQFSTFLSIRPDGGRPARSKPSTKIWQVLKPEYQSRVFVVRVMLPEQMLFKIIL